jgi:hypothetical protein
MTASNLLWGYRRWLLQQRRENRAIFYNFAVVSLLSDTAMLFKSVAFDSDDGSVEKKRKTEIFQKSTATITKNEKISGAYTIIE